MKTKPPPWNHYRCPACKKLVMREDTKQWRKGYCLATGKSVRLILQTKQETKPPNRTR